MLNISLMRMGAKGKPFYRVVVKEKRSKRDGKYLENVGTYNPMTDPSTVDLKHERIEYWISVGAQPTETVASLIKHNPFQTAEEKLTAVETRAAKVAADKQAKADARKAEAEAKQAEIERVAAEKAAAEKAEADAAAQAEADAAAAAEAEAAQSAETETASTEEATAESSTDTAIEEKPASE